MDGHDGSEAINYTFASKYKDLYHGVLCDISDICLPSNNMLLSILTPTSQRTKNYGSDN